MQPTPSDTVLLAARQFAPLGRAERVRREIDGAYIHGVGIFIAVGLCYAYADERGGNALLGWALGGVATAALLAVYVWKRFFRSNRPLLGSIDEPRLERMLFAAALLANEQQGLLRLAPDGIALHAEPTGAAPQWPADSLEHGLLRGRTLPVSELVSDFRTAFPSTLIHLVQSAARRGLLQAARAGPLWIPAPPGRNPAPAARLLDDCRQQRPAIWAALQSAIEAGYRERAVAPGQRFAAGAMPDSISVAEIEERRRIYKVPAEAIRIGGKGAAIIWAPILAAYALLPHPLVPFTPPRWPALVTAAVAAAVLIFDRWYRPAEPRPEAGMSSEEAALVAERSLSRRNPTWRESLTGAAATSGIACWLGLVFCSFGFAGSALYTLAMTGLTIAIVQRIRLARLPSAREIELAVARRSRALTQAHAAAPDVEIAQGPAAPGADAAMRRPTVETSARDLPPPSPSALARADQRRRAALFLLRRSAAAFVLLLAAQALLLGALWWRKGYDPDLLIFLAVVPLASLLLGARSVLVARHRLRPVGWQRDASLVGRTLRWTAARLPFVIPHAVRDALAAEPDFWRDEEPDIAAPLGLAPTICLAYWFFIVFVVSLTVLLQGPALLALAFAAAGLALAIGYRVHTRAAHAALARSMTLETGLRLLMLRVFGSPSFDELIALVKPWLLVGPISHLEGYDSIVRSPRARQLLAEGRLDDALIKTPEELAAQLAAQSATVGPDLRYRRYAFQCTDAVWKIAIREMLERSDVVVMDLSNLGPGNLGCAYELGLLLDRVSLARVLLLVSETTDRDCLRTILADAETRLSAGALNRRDPSAPWRLLRIGGSTARGAQESHLDWVRRLDNRLDPMQLVSHLIDMALAHRT